MINKPKEMYPINAIDYWKELEIKPYNTFEIPINDHEEYTFTFMPMDINSNNTSSLIVKLDGNNYGISDIETITFPEMTLVDDCSFFMSFNSSLREIDMTKVNTDKITNFKGFFDGINQTIIKHNIQFNENVTSTSRFLISYPNKSFIETFEQPEWTGSNVKAIDNMFYNCTFKNLILPNFNPNPKNFDTVYDTHSYFIANCDIDYLDIRSLTLKFEDISYNLKEFGDGWFEKCKINKIVANKILKDAFYDIIYQNNPNIQWWNIEDGEPPQWK